MGRFYIADAKAGAGLDTMLTCESHGTMKFEPAILGGSCFVEPAALY